MASISMPTALPGFSPFDSNSPPRSPSAHRRRPSRNPNAVPLPVFSFNPGVAEDTGSQENLESKSYSENYTITSGESSRRASRPPPLPDFTFNPGANISIEDRSPSPTHPVLQEMALNQQRASRSARPAPLPAFTFAPSTSPAQPSPSPTRSGFVDVTSSGRSSVGHRRRGSEFVGGGNEGNQLLSTSPEKPDSKPSGPPVSGMSRGHAHRRSQAVSISDIDTSDLIKVNAIAKARAGSQPVTPTEIPSLFSLSRSSPQQRQSISYSARSPPSSPHRRGSLPGVRIRVGFSDHVDVIPRPLSLISSATEGSTSTVRGGHSLSGSINSIASPSPQRASIIGSLASTESSPERPHTADPATLLSPGRSSVDRSLAIVNLPKRPLSASGSPGITSSGSPPNKKKSFWFTHSNNVSPTPTPTLETPDPIATLRNFAPATTTATELSRPKTSPERTVILKKTKYHTWTSGIFSRKAGKRSSKTKPKRTPTPQTLQRRTTDQLNEIFDADETVVLRDPSPVSQHQTLLEQQTRHAPVPVPAPKPVWQYEEARSRMTSPVLDLDAALGPFGSEEKFGYESGARKNIPRIAKLHSSERRGGVDAFGGLHRRAESAPSMPAINRSTFGVHHMGSNASLVEDVFDEEEEDNFLAGEQASAGEEEKDSIQDTDEYQTARVHKDVLDNFRSKSVEGLGLLIKEPSSDGIVIVDADVDLDQCDLRSSKSTIEAPPFAEIDLSKRPASSPMSFAYPAPQSQYASSTEGRTTSASMISSPDPEHITFDTFPRTTKYLGEPSPDLILRASNDDLPSLSDSVSSGVARISSSANTRSSVEQRSASVAVPTSSKSNQGWKRSSVASLNRLIPGSSNGSKLKFETIPDPATDEKSKKKINRISKLMSFWRSKEKIEN